ncbi:hypothetical protein BN7_6105 [Wickerhamomyces ciferrii]|uniref:Amino-acid acetyltransferase, mitochondrial n=1 Tax=Wickerhamomyces ciferrii (strain ATCC 14091 / BCRC 22168 / CBS 111 / JCM 3599 / NBRC 0793 / NRRL Y-1031 F-60-10) TaxID=1206466 RepID=K0KWU5_WICCF|nr:uncharacterized protein BN7_6105 [Wickerhamomyces ciferrii]CCH46512.1 hypothetical protein BN7_6105 [Wickerhamomyces ciferrii]
MMLRNGRVVLRRLLSTGPLRFENNLKQNSNDNKELMLSILKLTTTRRETNNYLNKYSSFSKPRNGNDADSPLRIVIFKLRGNVLHHDEADLKKFKKTLDYIQKLGASPLILIDPDFLDKRFGLNFRSVDNYLFNQFDHLNKCLGEKNILQISPLRCLLTRSQDEFSLDIPNAIVNPLKEGKLPVVFPYVFDKQNGKEVILKSTDYLKQFITNLIKINKPETPVLTVEKLVFIDKLGGIPSMQRSNNSHVYINLNQEYDRILSELNIGHLTIHDKNIHVNNLENIKDILDTIPDDVTGIITTLEIANENLNLNPIIYNILTDRSLISSSLPTTKLNDKQDVHKKVSKTTIIRKGLKINTFKTFKDVDLLKFKHLIDTSFKRSINLDHYISRVEPILSQIIIVGDYDGIAIITNEKSTKTGESVPYLDKFAVSRETQGSLNIADIIVNILKRDYREVLLWRSKKTNPVNGWYFQRSNGSLSLEDSEFRIFWIGKQVNNTKLETFVEIGKSIKPSWDK